MSMGQATGPIYTCETTGHAPAAVLDAHPERRRGTVSGQSAPNPMRCVSSCCQPCLSSPLDGMQANGKPLVSSTHAQTTTLVHGPDGPTRGRAEAMWGWRQNRSSKAGKVVAMRSHGACCFSMMRTNVLDALVAIEELIMDLSMSSRAPVGLPSVRHRGPSRLNLPLQAKVTGRF